MKDVERYNWYQIVLITSICTTWCIVSFVTAGSLAVYSSTAVRQYLVKRAWEKVSIILLIYIKTSTHLVTLLYMWYIELENWANTLKNPLCTAKKLGLTLEVTLTSTSGGSGCLSSLCPCLYVGPTSLASATSWETMCSNLSEFVRGLIS